jgi:hypothetical protein
MIKTFIYALIDPRDGLIKYIGKSNNPTKRYYHHLAETKQDFKTKKCNWLRKLLKENKKPTLEILEECNVNLWHEREIYWIDTINPSCNHKKGGGGSTHIPQIKTSKPVLQYSLDFELIKEYESLNEASRQTGLELANISNACNGKLKHTGFFVWKFKNEKEKRTCKEKAIRQIRKVIQLDKNKNIIKIYESINSASSEMNVPRTSISNCCFKNIDCDYYTAYGFIWKFYDKVYVL